MKIQIISDLHLETGVVEPDYGEADLLVIAGDISNGDHKEKAKNYIENMCSRYEYVLFIPGNHEYYHSGIGKIDIFWNTVERELDNFIFMQKRIWPYQDKISGEDYIFIGATLWSSITHDPSTAWKVSGALKDFRLIDDLGGIQGYQKLHEDHVRFLDEMLHSFTTGINPIVITHHCPHIKSIHKKYQVAPFNSINNGFTTNLDWLFKKHENIKLWIHGHTHDNFDYMVGNTRVLCNPKGYYNENNKFKKDLIIEC